jgi:quercetin dioxygenase-like cupin family protein
MAGTVYRATISLLLAGGTLVVLSVAADTHDARAEEGKAGAVVSPLLKKDLTGIAGKEAVMVTVEYPPGGSSAPHRHDAHVFVYVLSGTLRMQVDGQETVTLKPGQTFYESPQDIHRVSANASATEPAKFLVLMVKDQGTPTTHRVDAGPVHD